MFSQPSAAGRYVFDFTTSTDANVNLDIATKGAGMVQLPRIANASLLTCTAATENTANVQEGACAWDTTNHNPVCCDGTSQKALALAHGGLAGSWSAEDIGTAVAGGVFTGAYSSTVAGTMDKITCSWQVAGQISGNMVVHVEDYNGGAPSTLCTCTLGACTTAANVPLSCTCNTAFLANKLYRLVIDATSNCSAFPQNTICNTGLKQ
jgi:hypothetical protein